MRLFVALEIPAAVRDNLATVMFELRTLQTSCPAKAFRPVRQENVHLTLKFIGEVPAEKLGAIRGALATVRSARPMKLRFEGLGFFPNENQPRVLWAMVEAPPGLAALAAAIDRQLEAVHIAPEKRAFVPHLTLARFAPGAIPETMRAAIRKTQMHTFGVWDAEEFQLIESELKPAGAEYTRLCSFPFAAEN